MKLGMGRIALVAGVMEWLMVGFGWALIPMGKSATLLWGTGACPHIGAVDTAPYTMCYCNAHIFSLTVADTPLYSHQSIHSS